MRRGVTSQTQGLKVVVCVFFCPRRHVLELCDIGGLSN